MQDDSLLKTAELVADGQKLDWPTTRDRLRSPQDRLLADELAIVAQIARECRRFDLEGEPGADDTLPKRPGEKWGHLELLEVVGRGGYGTVFRAWDPQLEREVALKLFRRNLEPAKVIDEGRKLARVRHANVVSVFGADIVDGVAGIWMEFVRGRRLDQVIGDHGPFSAREAALIGLELAGALAAVHAAGLVHRDIKAQNVIREEGGRIVLMDLGAASLAPADLSAGVHDPDLVGTPAYMAPELFDLGAATRESDIYSLGVLLFYLVSAQFPIRARTIEELRATHRAGGARSLRDLRPELPSAYVSLVDRMTATQPIARYSSSGTLERDLSALAAHEAAAAAEAPVVAIDAGPDGRWPWMAAAVAVIALAIVASVWIATRGPGTAAPGAPRSIAVLPIRNLTGDKDLAYLADALTEVLISDLATIHALSVRSYAAVSNFRDSTQPSSVVARRLHADLLLAGTISRAGDRFRMTVQLIDPATDQAIWGEEVTRDPKDAMSAQSEIARMVAARLSLRLAPAEERALAPRPVKADAQDAYLRGLVELHVTSDVRAQAAVTLFHQAVDLDPTFASAWAHLALAQLRATGRVSFEARAQALNEIREAALLAIKLDPAGAPGYAALGNMQFYYDWDFPAADTSFKQSIQLSPSYAFAHQRYSMFLAALGRLDEALVEATTCRDLEPEVPDRITTLATIYFYRREYARAAEEARRALTIAPDSPIAHFLLGRIASAQHDDVGAIREIEAALSVSRNAIWLVELARVYTEAGMTADANRILAELERLRSRSLFGPVGDSYAYVAVAAGRLDEAFERLDQAVQDRVTNVLWIAVDPRADPLHADPRFAALLKRMKLQ